MSEERFEVKPYGVRYRCECGGEMKPSSHILMSIPPQYPHECNKCKAVVNLTKRYPTVEWEETDNA
ncbi:hypothetical protein CA600_12540 [Paenibacillus sp. VTT E-133280]|uniref:Cold-shock protein n=1 Tax=Paenibacillus odorifer TaxID=189426 RepID=A0AB36J720_9BACL|nr:hypothetical protein BSK47_30600 [Paenibacillus odorifer]OZQ66081.1 hypothetical protein CA600_12540 [Paenibacillus sp. VTT E-133280]